MAVNILSNIRTWSAKSSLIASILSNVIVFGQPIDQLASLNNNKLIAFDYQNSAYVDVSKHSFYDLLASSAPTDIKNDVEISETTPQKSVKNSASTLKFSAVENQGVIGKKTKTDPESPFDNYFTFEIPEDIDLSLYDAKLSYDLFGLSSAFNTNKSVNGSLSFGGVVASIDDSWKSVHEFIPVNHLLQGKNELYFNRRNDVLYQYQVKQVQVALVPKISNKSEAYFFDEKVYLKGVVDHQVIRYVKVEDQNYTVLDGYYEVLLDHYVDASKAIDIQFLNKDLEIISQTSIVPEIQKGDELIFFSDDAALSGRNHILSRDLSIEFNGLRLDAENHNLFSITGLMFKDLRGMSSDIVNVTSDIFSGYRVKNLSDNSDQEVSLSLAYDPAKIPNGYTAKDVRTFYYDQTLRAWKALPVDSIDIASHRVVTKLFNDTDYINGIIKVPESPEMANFSPTTITDMEFANPSDQVVSIAPPSPNNTGVVATSFPIKLPPGRNGLAPSLGVNYNSEGGNGWMGIGWDLQLPAISINTKWGVPRFDGTNESEIYSLNGSDLVYAIPQGNDTVYTNPHRHSNFIRQSNRIFYERVEGQYLKIERRGTAPSNYYWVVTDKQGNKNYYGGKTSVNDNAIIRDGNQNIVHWALFMTEDANGNNIEYFYSKGSVELDNSEVSAQTFYPDKIRYTRHPNQNSNFYEVVFRRNTYAVGQAGTLNRTDHTINGRLGTLQYTKDLLTEISVSFVQNNGTPARIRTYRFDYDEISFKKQQLIRITEYDAANQPFYSNTMEYYNDVSGTGLFQGNTNWSGTDDNIGSVSLFTLAGVPSSFLQSGSALGASSTSGWNTSARAGFGLGNKFFSKGLSIGGGGGYGKNTQNSLISFIDINGDGLPDKVYKSGNHLRYRINTGQGFGDAHYISGINSLDRTISGTTTFNADVAAFQASVGYSSSTTRSNTDRYFVDFNGDGLPDVVQNGTVWFNKSMNASDNLTRSFVLDVSGTENAITPGAVDISIINDIQLPTLLEVREEHSQFDHVMVWEAPYEGVVNISGQAKLIVKNDNNENPNNFRISIERTPPASNGIAASVGNFPVDILHTVDQTINTIRNGVGVAKGDRLFFRIHNLDEGSGGIVDWNPNIVYISSVVLPLNFTDENGKQANTFNAAQDFLLTNGSDQTITGVTSATINFNLNTLQNLNLTDDVRFKVRVLRINTNDDTETNNFYTKTYNHLTQAFTPNLNPVTVSLSSASNFVYKFICTIESDSNIDWGAIDWNPTLVAGGQTYHLKVNHKPYNNNVTQFNHRLTASQLPDPNIDNPTDVNQSLLVISHNLNNPSMNYSVLNNLGESFNIPVRMVVKTEVNGVVKVIGRRTISVIKSTSNQYTISPTSPQTITLTKGQVADLSNLYVAFYVEHPALATLLAANSYKPHIKLALTPAEQPLQTWNEVILENPFFAHSPNIFGNAYRGWGQFMYNGGIKHDRDANNEIIYDNNGNPQFQNFGQDTIDTSVFPSNSDLESLEGTIDDIVNNPGPNIPSGLDATLRYLSYDQNNQNNKYKNEAIIVSESSVNAGTIRTSLGRFGEGNLFDVYVDPQTLISGTGFAGIRQHSVSKGTSYSVGYSVASTSISESTSTVLNMYIDLNGDRYPDLITGSKVQYTNAHGSLTNVASHNFSTGSSSSDDYVGVSYTPTNSTASDNGKSSGNVTITNMSSGIGNSDGTTEDKKMWVDINGDGLPDQVRIEDNKVHVRLNTGYGFTANEIIWGSNLSQITSSRISPGGFNASFPLDPTGSLAVGLGFNSSFAHRLTSFTDVNGDGLPDWVYESFGSYYYRLNTGKGFHPTPVLLYNGGKIDEDRSYGGNLFGTGTIGFPVFSLFGLTIKFVATVSISGSNGFNHKHITMQDIDGDGYVDILEKKVGSGNSDLNVKLSKIGKTHLLKKVNLPMGGNWEVTYARNGNTYDLPQNKWVLDQVTVFDGFTGDSNFGPNNAVLTMVYEEPKYDRREREFLGFGKVTVQKRNPNNISQIHQYSISEYHNQNIYLKGAQKSTKAYDANDQLISESSTVYNLMHPGVPVVNLNPVTSIEFNNVYQNHYLQAGLSPTLLDHSRLFPAPVKTTSTMYEGTESLTAEQRFVKYDGKGNLKRYENLGDTYAASVAEGGDAFRTEIEYYSISDFNVNLNLSGLPKKISVIRASDNKLMRQRTAFYNAQGRLNKITTKLNDTENTTVTLEYNNFGNVTKINHLESLNQQNQHYFQTIAYDNVVHTYPVSMTDAFGHTTSTTYNYWFGIPTLTTDINNQQLRILTDNRGRVTQVTAPNEMPSGWTIKKEYKANFLAIAPGTTTQNTNVHHAVTRHNVAGAHSGQLITISLVDGLGTPIQLKKTILGENGVNWLVSGKEKKDNFGRVVNTWLPTVQTYATNITTLNNDALVYNTPSSNLAPPVEMVYDSRDRLVGAKQPDENDWSVVEYGIEDGMFVTNNINELGQKMATYTDIRGRQRKVVQNEAITTQFYYNAIGENVRVKNHLGYETLYKYDLAGRRVEERHPDRGLQVYKYAPSGNLIERQTSKMLSGVTQQLISYEYTYNRLDKINYPDAANNVTYTYGAPGNPEAIAMNAVGRLFQQVDASGTQGFGYDKLGNLDRHLRSVAVAGRSSFWFRTLWEYDSFNRIKEITYPDEEVVTYHYNQGGTLQSINSVIPSVGTQNIVSSISYTNLGERKQMVYGNNTVTNYTYDSRRRLKTIAHQFNNFNIAKQYTYDPLSNIKEINTLNPQNSMPGNGQIGGPSWHTYGYDGYNRLVTASGGYVGPNDLSNTFLAQEYSLAMEYDMSHNIVSKQQTHIQGEVSAYGAAINDPETVHKTNYFLQYDGYAGANYIASANGGEEFGYAQPHAPREITEVPEESCCDETDPRHKKHLIDYDANGNRTTIKQSIAATSSNESPTETILRQNLWDDEDRLRAVDLNPEESQPHPLAVYTYDAAGQRIVRYIPGRVDAKSNAHAVSMNETDEIMIYPNGLVSAKVRTTPGVAPSARNTVTSYTKHYYIGASRVSSAIGTTITLGLFPKIMTGAFPGIQTAAATTVTNASQALQTTYEAMGQNLTLAQPTIEDEISTHFHTLPYDAYFYHSDHLGSSNYITNLAGDVTQHMEYLPFGELLVDEHLNSYNTPFKFNAKEFDAETGNYYYGARYYDPKFSVWLSVDPLAEKYPGISSYAYVANNPLKYIDPDGKRIVDPKSILKASYLKASYEMIIQSNLKKQSSIFNSATNKNGDIKLSKSQRKEITKIQTNLRELNKSISDINDMMKDDNNAYRYEKASLNGNLPETVRTDRGEVTMFTDSFSTEVHESRHGGQIARGEFDVNSNRQVISGTYGASKEIDAYRAQLAAVGEIEFEPYRDYNSGFSNFREIGTKEKITDFSEINNKFLEQLVDNPGINQERIYGTQKDNPTFYEN